MKIKIDKNIPIPDKFTKSEFPFSKMAIGDSFFSDDELSHIENAKYRYLRKNKEWGFKFVTNKTEGGYRIWRIK